jgi:RNA polymerase sigma-70 factor (ECF subfamily)
MSHDAARAFEHVFRREHTAIVAFCFRRVDDYELARDLAAETFRIAWTRWAEPRRSDRAWLFGVARNLIGSEYRRRATAGPVTTRGLEEPSSRNDYLTVDVQQTLASLSSTHQEVLRLSYWDGLSAAEIAEVLGIATPATWVRLSRARRAFTAAWTGRPVTPAATRERTAR